MTWQTKTWTLHPPRLQFQRSASNSQCFGSRTPKFGSSGGGTVYYQRCHSSENSVRLRYRFFEPRVCYRGTGRHPQATYYDTLKTQLIKRTAASEQRKLQQLFSGEELGDRKPTQLLRRMQQLVGDKLGTADNDSFLRELFLQRLPPNVRMILASSDSSLSLDKLAELADKVAEVALPTVATVIETPPQPDEVKQLRAEVARLKDRLESMNTELRRRSPKPRRSPKLPKLARPRSLILFAGTIESLEMQPRSVMSHVHGG